MREAGLGARAASIEARCCCSVVLAERSGRERLRRGGKGAAASPQPRLSSCSLWATRSSSASMAARLSSSWSCNEMPGGASALLLLRDGRCVVPTPSPEVLPNVRESRMGALKQC